MKLQKLHQHFNAGLFMVFSYFITKFIFNELIIYKNQSLENNWKLFFNIYWVIILGIYISLLLIILLKDKVIWGATATLFTIHSMIVAILPLEPLYGLLVMIILIANFIFLAKIVSFNLKIYHKFKKNGSFLSVINKRQKVSVLLLQIISVVTFLLGRFYSSETISIHRISGSHRSYSSIMGLMIFYLSLYISLQFLGINKEKHKEQLKYFRFQKEMSILLIIILFVFVILYTLSKM